MAVELDPDYTSALANLALVEEKLNMDNEAIQAYEKLIALGDISAMSYFHLGVLYAKGNQPDKSIEAFTQAIKLEPEKCRSMLREELKNVHSVLENVRYKKEFRSLLAAP